MSMHSRISALLALGLAWPLSSAANAQSTRTFVSGAGDDAAACSRVAPCKTFAGAFAKTSAGGEINCLDVGSYGGLIISKSISIVCDIAIASIVGGTTDAITINAAATDKVTISGLDIKASASLAGINATQVGELRVVNTNIRGGGNGLLFAPTTIASLFIADCDFSHNGSAAFGSGLVVAPSGAGGANVHVERTRLKNNGNGIRANAAASTGGINVNVRDSVIAGSLVAGVDAGSSSGGSAVAAMLTGTMISGNATGLKASTSAIPNGAFATVRIGGSTITANTTAMAHVNLGFVISHGNNKVIDNAGGETFSANLALK